MRPGPLNRRQYEVNNPGKSLHNPYTGWILYESDYLKKERKRKKREGRKGEGRGRGGERRGEKRGGEGRGGKENSLAIFGIPLAFFRPMEEANAPQVPVLLPHFLYTSVFF